MTIQEIEILIEKYNKNEINSLPKFTGKKLYVIKEPLSIRGIYLDWEKVKYLISGVSGVIYKSFKNLDEAANFYKLNNSEDDFIPDLEIYVDGSYNEETKEAGSGLIFLKDNEIIYENKFSSKDLYNGRNITGEINAILFAINLLVENGNTAAVNIYHDLQHLGAWAKGNYKANTIQSRHYVELINELTNKLTVFPIRFTWIKGHSDNYYNDYVDRLAKESIRK